MFRKKQNALPAPEKSGFFPLNGRLCRTDIFIEGDESAEDKSFHMVEAQWQPKTKLFKLWHYKSKTINKEGKKEQIIEKFPYGETDKLWPAEQALEQLAAYETAQQAMENQRTDLEQNIPQLKPLIDPAIPHFNDYALENGFIPDIEGRIHDNLEGRPSGAGNFSMQILEQASKTEIKNRVTFPTLSQQAVESLAAQLLNIGKKSVSVDDIDADKIKHYRSMINYIDTGLSALRTLQNQETPPDFEYENKKLGEIVSSFWLKRNRFKWQRKKAQNDPALLACVQFYDLVSIYFCCYVFSLKSKARYHSLSLSNPSWPFDHKIESYARYHAKYTIGEEALDSLLNNYVKHPSDNIPYPQDVETFGMAIKDALQSAVAKLEKGEDVQLEADTKMRLQMPPQFKPSA